MSLNISNAVSLSTAAMGSLATDGIESAQIYCQPVAEEDLYLGCDDDHPSSSCSATEHIRCAPGSITIHDAYPASHVVHPPRASLGTGAGYLATMLLLGAIGMAHAKPGAKKGLFAGLKRIFGGSKNEAERAAEPSEARTILMIARKTDAPRRVANPGASGLKPDPVGALIGTTALLQSMVANIAIKGDIDVHKGIGIAQSIVVAIARNPSSVSDGTIPTAIVRQAMAEHEVFAFKDGTVPFPGVDAEMSIMFRNAYDDLISHLATDPGFCLEEGENPDLRKGRIEGMAAYYIYKWIHMLIKLWEVSFYSINEEHLRGVTDKVTYDLSLTRKNMCNFYGIAERDEIEGRGIATTIGGRNVYAWKLAHALKIDAAAAQEFLDLNGKRVAEYVRTWELMAYASQLIYTGGFEEFLAQDMLPGGETSEGKTAPIALVRNRKHIQREALMNEANWIAARGGGSSAQLNRVRRIAGRIIDVQSLSANLSTSITETLRQLDRYDRALENMDPSLWDEPSIRDGGGYDRVVAYAIRQLSTRPAVAETPKPSSLPPKTVRKRPASPLMMGMAVPESLRGMVGQPRKGSDPEGGKKD